jgi:tetratricopeptide (TPR) repeat protein
VIRSAEPGFKAGKNAIAHALLAAVGLGAFTGCDKIITDKPSQKMAAADAKAKAGEYRLAVRIYESALDGSDDSAEVHYRLAVIYDEKLKRPLDALHHFTRYLELAPKGIYAKEAGAYKKEAEAKWVRGSSNSGPASQSELVRLKNENLNLQKQLLEQKQRATALSVSAARRAEEAKAPLPPGSKRHTVVAGETPASISHKYYGTRARAQDILDANHNQLGGKSIIRPGQVLIIP